MQSHNNLLLRRRRVECELSINTGSKQRCKYTASITRTANIMSDVAQLGRIISRPSVSSWPRRNPFWAILCAMPFPNSMSRATRETRRPTRIPPPIHIVSSCSWWSLWRPQVYIGGGGGEAAPIAEKKVKTNIYTRVVWCLHFSRGRVCMVSDLVFGKKLGAKLLLVLVYIQWKPSAYANLSVCGSLGERRFGSG